jgi:hypothetical protein
LCTWCRLRIVWGTFGRRKETGKTEGREERSEGGIVGKRRRVNAQNGVKGVEGGERMYHVNKERKV